MPENSKEPLWLPKGSVRAIIALAVVGAGIGMFAIKGNIPEALVGIIGMIVGFYFGKKAGEEKPQS